MLTTIELGDYVTNFGLLLGLLTDEGNGNVSFNTDWFANAVSELEAVPTRVPELLDVLSLVFDPVGGTAYTLLPQTEAWYSIFSGYDELPTGLCLVTPPPGATSGVISFGIFNQFVVNNLTVSMYARLPLFYAQAGQNPQFILASDLTQYKNFQIELDVYSSVALQTGSDSPFNLMSVSAQADFNDSFTTTFNLAFYQNFDPKTGDKTPLPAADTETIIARIGELVVQANYWLNTYIGSAPVTIGDILSATGLVTQTVDATSGITTYNFDQSTFDAMIKDPTAALEKFLISLLTKLLDELASAQTLLVPILGGGIYATKDTATNTYGLRLAIPDYDLTSSVNANPPATTPPPNTQGAPPNAGPQVIMQLGKWFTGETTASNWIQRISNQQVDPGIDIFFLHYDGTTLSTTAYVKLASLGIDITGQGDAPLININGYTLKGAELRAYLDSNDWSYGFALRLDNIGFPLGTTFNQTQQGSAGSNMVAKSLMASDGSQQSGTGQTSAVNPSFSAEAGYMSPPPAPAPAYPPLLEVFDAQGNQTDVIWFPIQRRFGPINCQKIGLEVETTGAHTSDPVLGIIFDGDVSLGGLDVYLDQLSIGVHLKEATDPAGYDVDLQGMDVTFSGGGVEISGGLLKTTDPTTGFIGYDGEAIMKIESLTVAALGSFGSLPGGGTSLFIFAMLNYPLGGPSFFFVTGLSAGFGYNRSLKIPAQSDVQNFPLVAGLANTAILGGNNPSPAQALTALEQWVPPARGEYWLAAGLQFTTFDIINTNALLMVEFGKEFIIALLGLSTLKQPQVGETYIYAELDIEVVLDPAAGEFKASAVLAPNSYVFTPQLRMTGGFAFYAWFGDNAHAGDFAFTIGGYHPAFKAPDYYPQEPRVGINWQISDMILMSGDAYFAITPTAMMAGGGLQLTFTDGPLKAWFKAQLDIILYWKPFYLIADASISIGVSYRIDLLFVHKTLSVEISADFDFWGPPIGGKVHIDWYIISFTISFGPQDPTPPTDLNWSDFKGMLPSKAQQPPSASPAPQPMLAAGAASSAPAATPPPIPVALYINANAGLKTTQTEDGLTLWLVRAGQFQFTVGSAVPATTILVGDPNSSNHITLTGQPVGLRRVNGGIPPGDYLSTQTVTILQLSADDINSIKACMATADPPTTQPSGCAGQPVPVADWQTDAVTQNLPQAMWGGTESPDINQTPPTVTGTIGVTMYPQQPAITNCTPQMNIATIFADRTVNPDDEYQLPLSQTLQPVANAPQAADSFTDIAHVNDPTVVAARAAVFAALLDLGVNAWTNEPLPQMAALPGQDFADEPLEGSVVSNPT